MHLSEIVLNIGGQEIGISQQEPSPAWVNVRDVKTNNRLLTMRPEEFKVFVDWLSSVSKHLIMVEPSTYK
jgi:hypothetical protein